MCMGKDALGTVLEEICKVVPDGALIFFPSFKLLDKLCARWQATGQWTRLLEEKQLFVGNGLPSLVNAEEQLSCFILKYGIDCQVDSGFTGELYSTVL